MATQPAPSTPRRRRRLILWGLLIAVAIPALAALALPWALSSRPGRAWLLARANRAMAPGRFELSSLRFSWFGPTRMTGFVIRDASGGPVVDAPRATWDRNLGQVLFARPKLGTLQLDRAALDVERAPDGKINLYEALRPVIGLNPKTSARIEVRDGSLRVHGAGLAEPVTAGHAGITVDVAPGPGPITWKARLAQGKAAGAGNTLDVDGRYDRGWPHPEGPFDLDLRVSGRGWPWALGGRRVSVSGRLDGAISATRRAGAWKLAGDAAFGRVEASGTLLAGDELRLDGVRGAWDADQTAEGWSVRRFEFTSPVATLRADGAVASADALGGSARLDGTIDLAAIAAQIPHALRLREGVALDRGTAALRIETRQADGAPVLDVSAKVSDLVARDAGQGRSFTLRDPASLAARLRRSEGVIEVERLSAETPYLNVEARGGLARGVTLAGTIDLAGLQRQFRDLVDFGAVELAGKGELKGNYRAGADRFHPGAERFDAGVTADLKEVRIAGVGPATVEKEAVNLEVTLNGPAGASGLPEGWAQFHSRLDADKGHTSGGLDAAVNAGSVDGSAWVSLPIDLNGRKTRGDGLIHARWGDRDVILDKVKATLQAGDDEDRPEPLQLSARGRYDRTDGVLTLTATDEKARPGLITLEGDGVRVSGLGAEGVLNAEGELGGDLAGLAWLIPSAPEGLRGRWRARAVARSVDDGLRLGGLLRVKGLAAGSGDGDGETVGLEAGGLLTRDRARLDVSELALRSRFGVVEASGRVDDPGGKRQADLSGRLAPNWDAINEWLASHVEPRATVTGRPRALKLRGELREGGRETLEGEVGLAIDGADVYGLKVGSTEVVVRAREGKLVLDPIESTVNNGPLHVEGSFRGRDGSEPAAFLLDKGTTLAGAEVNDEVSRRVLSFVAPVLDNATRVRGRVSASIDRAVFPIGEAPGGHGPTVDGSVVFQDVEFVAGPLLDDLFTLVGREDRPALKLDQPVSLTIADRRVYQRGLSVPVANLSRIDLEGWVGFDRALNLTASVPILPTPLADRPILGAVAGDARIRVPIRGTLQHPEIDREAFKLGMKDMGRSLLERGAIGGAAGLIERLARPRDPDTPPPPTPEERRARRQERRAERQMRRGRLPDE